MDLFFFAICLFAQVSDPLYGYKSPVDILNEGSRDLYAAKAARNLQAQTFLMEEQLELQRDQERRRIADEATRYLNRRQALLDEEERLAQASAPQRDSSGCCSWHDGVCGCSYGRVECCDGTTSPTCRCR